MPDKEKKAIKKLRVVARRAGLDMTDEELKAVLPGVERNRLMAKTVREWVDAGIEPATASLTPRAQG